MTPLYAVILIADPALPCWVDPELILVPRFANSLLAVGLNATVRVEASVPLSRTRYFMDLALLELPRFFRSTATPLMACFLMVVRIPGSSGI
jgi:hypothetical protein